MNTAVPPIRRMKGDRVTLAHGGGGKAMHDLIEDVFTSVFEPASTEDQARLYSSALVAEGAQLAFTTDSFVVDPLEFPGGDIGKIAVCGTVNDLAVGGAQPLWLSAAFIIEEGLEVSVLRKLVRSMRDTADEVGIKIVTGDTKIVGRGAADKVFITTSGIGVIPPERKLAATQVQPGDIAIVNGVLGDHGAAILAARGDMALTSDIASDCQPLSALMEAVLEAAPSVRACRDATRGGVASALNEIAQASHIGIEIDETTLPLRTEVKGVCEILGLDPLYLANEGTLVLFVPAEQSATALSAMRSMKAGENAVAIGVATESHPATVVMKTVFGGKRIVDMLVGEQLPRIC